MNRLLLCPPDFYTVRYEINPWMDRAREVNHALACDEWAHLCRTLASLDQHMKLVPAEKDWPDMVFTANAGLVQGRRVLLSNFRHPERAGEEPEYERWFRANGYEVTRLPPVWPSKVREMRCGSMARSCVPTATGQIMRRMREFTIGARRRW